MNPFFPSPLFAWVFVVSLTGLLAAAAWTDMRRLVIPKALSLVMLASGTLLTVARGVLLGADGHRVWLFEEPAAATGGLDGLLFAIAGFGVGFAVFFVFWVLNVCGGGDVKVGAALGAWLGPLYILGAILFTLPVVLLLFVGTMIWRGVVPKAGMSKIKRRLMGFALPLAVATAALLFWGFRYELGLLPGPPAAP